MEQQVAAALHAQGWTAGPSSKCSISSPSNAAAAAPATTTATATAGPPPPPAATAPAAITPLVAAGAALPAAASAVVQCSSPDAPSLRSWQLSTPSHHTCAVAAAGDGGRASKAGTAAVSSAADVAASSACATAAAAGGSGNGDGAAVPTAAVHRLAWSVSTSTASSSSSGSGDGGDSPISGFLSKEADSDPKNSNAPGSSLKHGSGSAAANAASATTNPLLCDWSADEGLKGTDGAVLVDYLAHGSPSNQGQESGLVLREQWQQQHGEVLGSVSDPSCVDSSRKGTKSDPGLVTTKLAPTAAAKACASATGTHPATAAAATAREAITGAGRGDGCSCPGAIPAGGIHSRDSPSHAGRSTSDAVTEYYLRSLCRRALRCLQQAVMQQHEALRKAEGHAAMKLGHRTLQEWKAWAAKEKEVAQWSVKRYAG